MLGINRAQDIQRHEEKAVTPIVGTVTEVVDQWQPDTVKNLHTLPVRIHWHYVIPDRKHIQ